MSRRFLLLLLVLLFLFGLFASTEQRVLFLKEEEPEQFVVVENETTAAKWVQDQTWCSSTLFSKYHCTPSRYRYSPLDVLFDMNSSCALFQRLNITRVLSIGDSYLRHFHVALKLVLSNDYVTGGTNGQPVPSCLVDDGQGQFAEKDCRGYVATSGTFCEERLTVDVHASEHPNFDAQQTQEYDLIVWGHGNHVYFNDPSQPKLDKECFNPLGRTGTMDWEYHKTNVFPAACGWHKQGNYKARIFWFPPHQTLRDEGGEDCPKNRRRFAQETATTVKDICGVETFMEQFTLTDELVFWGVKEELDQLTYDKYHWSRVVNLVKVQTFLHYLNRVHYP